MSAHSPSTYFIPCVLGRSILCSIPQYLPYIHKWHTTQWNNCQKGQSTFQQLRINGLVTLKQTGIKRISMAAQSGFSYDATALVLKLSESSRTELQADFQWKRKMDTQNARDKFKCFKGFLLVCIQGSFALIGFLREEKTSLQGWSALLLIKINSQKNIYIMAINKQDKGFHHIE